MLSAALFLIGPLLFCWRYVRQDGTFLTFGEALHHVYFLLYGQPSLPYVHDWLIELLNLVIPPVGIWPSTWG